MKRFYMEYLLDRGDCAVELPSPDVAPDRAVSLAHHLSLTQLELHFGNLSRPKLPATAVHWDLHVLHGGEDRVQVEGPHLQAQGQVSAKNLDNEKKYSSDASLHGSRKLI